MSGYGGQPPPGWGDPYDPYGAPGYGTPGYGPPGYEAPGYGPPGYEAPGYGPPGVPPGSSGSNASAITALICSAVAVTMCCNVFAIPGIVTGTLALSRSSTDPASSRSLTMWTWVIFGVAIALGIAVFLVLILVGAFSDPEYDSGYGSGGV